MAKKEEEFWAQDGDKRWKLEGKELEQFLKEKENAIKIEQELLNKKKAIYEKLGLTDEEINAII